LKNQGGVISTNSKRRENERRKIESGVVDAKGEAETGEEERDGLGFGAGKKKDKS